MTKRHIKLVIATSDCSRYCTSMCPFAYREFDGPEGIRLNPRS